MIRTKIVQLIKENGPFSFSSFSFLSLSLFFFFSEHWFQKERLGKNELGLADVFLRRGVKRGFSEH